MEEIKKIITAFQTAGYISLLAARFLEEKGVVKDIGGIDLDEMSQFSVIKNGEMLSPVRMLEGKDFIIITSHIPLQINAVSSLSKKVIDLYKEKNASQMIALDGLSIEKPQDKSNVYFASTYTEKEIKNCKKLPEGAMMGFNSYIANQCRNLGIPFIVLMAETHNEIPDGIAAAALIDVLGEFIDLKIDTSELVSEYKKTLIQINNLVKRLDKTPKNEEQNMYV
ncbi:MAG: protein of unknown function DUF75 [Candidatus Parvarchaeum acidophilus ARMAN-5]|jgi:predicted ATP-grasp superfamily ATP-dependent carboligase|uniref:Proteasome assembly chaperone family protein n=1 Tax=Candidatus Parvarchaeum acidophilus ARMAN-5 TaxID=662762 RepID=D6GUW3_PARA5|nr:MAG: protein of unknown function DUF75 [Candidatus Parvarchaeum acidophilus ARMAN-5]